MTTDTLWRILRRPRIALAVATMAGFALSLSAHAQPAPRDQGAWAYLAGVPADKRMAVLEKEAKADGKLVVYGALGIDRANIFLKMFNENYPSIKTEFVRLRESELVQKMLIELQTGRVNSDAAISGVDKIDLLKPTLAPYEPTTWGAFDPRFREGSFKDGWTAISYELLPTTIAWRTDRVSKVEAPKTLDEVADPKWKDRTGTHISIEKFIEAMVVKYGQKVGMEKVEKLAAIGPRLYASTAALSQGLAAGEIDLAWEFQAHRPSILKAQGAPIDFYFQKPLFGLGVTISVVKGAQHPYAAALFMDFLTSAKVLEVLDKAEGGRIFGNTKGKFDNQLSQFPDLTTYRPLAEARFKELSKEAERLFIRK